MADDDDPASGSSNKAAPPPPGRFRAQALGLLALSVSVAAVMLAVFVYPHGGGRAQLPKPSRAPGPTSTVPAVPTTAGTSTTPSTAASKVPPTDSARTTTAAPSSSTSPVTSGAPAPVMATVTTATPASVTSTPPPSFAPGHEQTTSWSGTLDDPFTSANYPVTTEGGVVSATATWSGTPTLTLKVTCPGAKQTRRGTSGLYVSATATAGTCSIILAEPPGVGATVSFSLATTYPGT